MPYPLRLELIDAGVLKPAKPDWQNDRHPNVNPTPLHPVQGIPVLRLDAAGKRAAVRHVREYQTATRTLHYRGI